MYLESGEVDDIVNVWVLGEDLVQRCFVCNITFVKGGSLAADELDAVDDFWRRVVEIVDDDDLVVCLKQGKCCEGANVACATARCLACCVMVCGEAPDGMEGQLTL